MKYLSIYKNRNLTNDELESNFSFFSHLNKYRYIYSSILITTLYFFNFNFTLTKYAILISSIFIYYKLVFCVFKTPKIIQITELLSSLLLDIGLSYYDYKNKKEKEILTGLKVTNQILRKKYFGRIRTIYYFVHITFSFLILILNSSYIFSRLYKIDTSLFSIPNDYNVIDLDFFILVSNSFLLIDYSIIGSNSVLISTILTLHSLLFIIVSLMCLFILSLDTSIESIELGKDLNYINEGGSLNEKDNLSFSIQKFNTLLQSLGILEAIKLFKKQRKK